MSSFIVVRYVWQILSSVCVCVCGRGRSRNLFVPTPRPHQWAAPKRTILNKVNILNNLPADTAINSYFDEQKEKILYCDASPFGLSSILLQNDNKGHLQVISYLSRTLNTTEQRYSQLEREYLSIVYACQRHRVYLFGRTFKIYSDNKAVFNLLSRWYCNLWYYNYKVMILTYNT